MNAYAVRRLASLGAGQLLLGLQQGVMEPVIEHINHLWFRPSITTY